MMENTTQKQMNALIVIIEGRFIMTSTIQFPHKIDRTTVEQYLTENHIGYQYVGYSDEGNYYEVYCLPSTMEILKKDIEDLENTQYAIWEKYNYLKSWADTPVICTNCRHISMHRSTECPNCHAVMKNYPDWRK